MKMLFSSVLAAALISPAAAAQNPLAVRSGNTEISISPGGEITGIRRTGTHWSKHLRGLTLLDSCRQAGENRVERTARGGVQVTRHFVSEARNIRLTVTDRFTPGASSILWEVEVEGGASRGRRESERFSNFRIRRGEGSGRRGGTRSVSLRSTGPPGLKSGILRL